MEYGKGIYFVFLNLKEIQIKINKINFNEQNKNEEIVKKALNNSSIKYFNFKEMLTYVCIS